MQNVIKKKYTRLIVVNYDMGPNFFGHRFSVSYDNSMLIKVINLEHTDIVIIK